MILCLDDLSIRKIIDNLEPLKKLLDLESQQWLRKRRLTSTLIGTSFHNFHKILAKVEDSIPRITRFHKMISRLQLPTNLRLATMAVQLSIPCARKSRTQEFYNK